MEVAINKGIDMTSVLMVVSDKTRFQQLASGLGKEVKTATIQWADTAREALRLIKNNPPAVAVVDESLADMSGLDFVRRVVGINPWVQTAVVSHLSPETFHQTTEGLGVAVRLPGNPDISDAEPLIRLMDQVPAPSEGAWKRGYSLSLT